MRRLPFLLLAVALSSYGSPPNDGLRQDQEEAWSPVTIEISSGHLFTPPDDAPVQVGPGLYLDTRTAIQVGKELAAKDATITTLQGRIVWLVVGILLAGGAGYAAGRLVPR